MKKGLTAQGVRRKVEGARRKVEGGKNEIGRNLSAPIMAREFILEARPGLQMQGNGYKVLKVHLFALHLRTKAVRLTP
jgi:hypothetical protein